MSDQKEKQEQNRKGFLKNKVTIETFTKAITWINK